MYSAEVITPQHLTRKAVIYIRQSTPHQALSHQESLRLQYALTERAQGLGWAPEAIEVVDTDGFRGPAQPLSALGERVLEPEAFLMAQRLVRGRLTNIDDRFAGQMLGGDDFGAVHRLPPGRWPRVRRGWRLG